MIRPFGRSGWSYNYFEIKMWQYSHYNSEVVIIPEVVTKNIFTGSRQELGLILLWILSRVLDLSVQHYPKLTTIGTINRSLFLIPSSSVAAESQKGSRNGCNHSPS